MRPLLLHASRSVFVNVALAIPPRSSRLSVNLAKSASSTPSICVQCQFRASIATTNSPRDQLGSKPSNLFRRRFHQTPNDERKPQDEKKLSVETPIEPGPTPDVTEPSSTSTNGPTTDDTSSVPKKEETADSIPRVPAEDLPSHREAQRWNFSKRLAELMDELLPKLAVVTQKVNTLTGTDYSGIDALKREIKEHGKLSARCCARFYLTTHRKACKNTPRCDRRSETGPRRRPCPASIVSERGRGPVGTETLLVGNGPRTIHVIDKVGARQ